MILNEEQYIKDLILRNNDEVKKIKPQVNFIARYNYHVMKMSDNDNYNAIVSWMNRNNNGFCENNYSKFIESAVKKSKNKPLYLINSIKFTQEEIDCIQSLNNLRYEKIMFVLLCTAKFQQIVHGYTDGLIYYNITQVFKDARVSVSKNNRENILHELLKINFIKLPYKNDSKCLFVTIIDNENKPKYEILPHDCNELAYFYMKISGDKKINRCKKCNKLIKINKRYGNLCPDCFTIPTNMRKIKCQDCGKEVEISIFNSKTIRCEACQKLKNNEIKREYREKLSTFNDIQ